jgi:hypothetical protein
MSTVALTRPWPERALHCEEGFRPKLAMKNDQDPASGEPIDQVTENKLFLAKAPI